MKSKIINRIKALESDRDIKVLLACETGSRAWGFPSPDSDYDVRMIYMHPKDWYLSLSPKQDHINLMLDEKMIDISAWDLRKSLNLLYRSNAALLERVQSPLIYLYTPQFREELIELADQFYAPIAVMYHYLSIAKKKMHEINEMGSMNLKKFFYALRSALVCKWVVERGSRPPISILDLLNG
jgi:predicted nucleotidyltransferase